MALQKYSDKSVRTPASVMAYIANPCVRTDLQVRLVWFLIEIRNWEYEANIEMKAREQQLELMGAIEVL